MRVHYRAMSSAGKPTRADREPSRGSPRERELTSIRERLGHPVIDIDGHCIEFFPGPRAVLTRRGRRPREPEPAPVAAAVLRARRRLARPRRGERERFRARATAVVGLSGAQHPRPRHRDVPRPPVRAPRRARDRRERRVPERRAHVPASLGRARNGAAHAGALNRCNANRVRRLRGSPGAGRGDPDAHARRGDRRAGVRGRHAGLQGGAARRLRAATDRASRTKRNPSSRRGARGSTCTASTARTTTTRCGRSASTSASRSRSTPGRSVGEAAARSRATCTTTSAISPRASTPLCKSLFLGGVTRRFPTLNFAFLEGGVSWAAALLSDLVGHWEKRNRTALAHLDPAAIDKALFFELMAQLRRRAHRSLRAHAHLSSE